MNSARTESAKVRREVSNRVRTNPWKQYFADGARTAPAVLIAGVLMLACELVYLFGPRTMTRCGLEKWFDWLISHVHLNQILVLPVLTLGVLLAWHYRRGDSWRVKSQTMLALIGESIAIGLVLAVIVKVFRLASFTGAIENEFAWSIAAQMNLAIPSLAAVVSASIHEEVFFRLGMLGGGIALARRLGFCHRNVQAGLVVVVSLLFAAIHYSMLNPVGESIDVAGFFCRFGVGMVFGTVYLSRGLALAIGIHCVYNVVSLL